MQTSTFNAGLRLGQMIHLLTPAGQGNKPFGKALARLRSHLESLVVGATLSGELGEQAAQTITTAEEALAESMARHLDLAKMLTSTSSMTRLIWTKISIAYGGQTGEGLLESAQKALSTGPELRTLNVMSKAQRADLLHTYASLVRNSGWMPTLMRLGFNAHSATLRGADLLAHYSSTPGRAQIQDNLKKFALTDEPNHVPEALGTSNAAVSVAGRFATQVVLLPEAFADPLIASLTALRHPDPTRRSAEDRALANLLEAASKPALVPKGETPEVVAQSTFDTLVNALRERQKTLSAAGVKLREAVEKAAEAQAIEDLKRMDPKLIKLLKSKPDLLKGL